MVEIVAGVEVAPPAHGVLGVSLRVARPRRLVRRREAVRDGKMCATRLADRTAGPERVTELGLLDAEGASVPDVRAMEQKAQEDLDSAMTGAKGDRGGGDDEGGGKKKGGKSSEGEPHEFEKKGAAVLQNRYILVTLKDGPDRDTPRRGRVTATGGTSAQIVWDGGGQEIIDLGQPDVVFVEESTKLRFEGGNPGLEGFILVILSLQDLEGSRRFVVILNPDKLGFG